MFTRMCIDISIGDDKLLLHFAGSLMVLAEDELGIKNILKK